MGEIPESVKFLPLTHKGPQFEPQCEGNRDTDRWMLMSLASAESPWLKRETSGINPEK